MPDFISDMLTSIRNAQAVSHPTVDVPFSKIKYEIAKILEKEGFVEKLEKKKKRTKKGEGQTQDSVIEITLKYNKDKTPVVSGLKKISKQGQRIYFPWKKIKKVKGGYGIAIISTSKGLMTGKEARKQKIGGEVICEVW